MDLYLRRLLFSRPLFGRIYCFRLRAEIFAVAVAVFLPDQPLVQQWCYTIRGHSGQLSPHSADESTVTYTRS